LNNISIIILIISFLPIVSSGQDTSSYILSGTVVNGLKNIPLEGAHLISSKQIGTKTNIYGEFNLNVLANDTIKISYIGYKPISYITPTKQKGQYLIKFKIYKDSVSLEEIEIFPWPTYKEFKKAFVRMNKEKEKVKMKGVNMYVDKSTEPVSPTVFSPISFIYDKLFDKQAKMRRRLNRRRKTIKTSISE